MEKSINTANNKKNWLVGALVVTWFASVIFAFWWFQFRNIQAFDIHSVVNKTVFFESGELGSRLEYLAQQQKKEGKFKPVTVVHFWNPACPCTRFNEVHVKQIIENYADKNVRFTVVVAGESIEQRKVLEQQARDTFAHPAVTSIRSDWTMNNGPPSSPAVGVINEKGELVYFGPYSLGANCSPENGQFVESVLDRLQNEKQQKKQLNTLAVGCFCPWRSVS